MQNSVRLYALQKVSSLQEAGGYGLLGALAGGTLGLDRGLTLQHRVGQRQWDAANVLQSIEMDQDVALANARRAARNLADARRPFYRTMYAEAQDRSMRELDRATEKLGPAKAQLAEASEAVAGMRSVPRKYAVRGALGLGALGAGIGLLS